MATIGTFKATTDNEFTGEIVTLSVLAKNVRIVPGTRATARMLPATALWSAGQRSEPPGPRNPMRVAIIWA